MYKSYEAVSDEELAELKQLSEEVIFKPATGWNRRCGANKDKVMSRYNVAKWFDWKHAQRELFRTKFPEPIQTKILQGWFLDIPRGTGFLDLMDYWVGKPNSGTVVITALRDQTIYIDRKEIHVRPGQQLGFNLQQLHEIKPSKEGQLWACVMFLGCPMQLKD